MTATAGSTAGSLVGRSEELETLGRLLDEACDGNSRLVVVSGEPGIGKTSLLAEFAGAAAARGCLVLQGRASELERELPFAPIVDAFDSHLASLDRDTVERLAPDELRELGAVFPALGSLQPSSGHPRTAAERFRAHHAIHELVERLAARQPVLITLDDLHWADGASLELLGYSVRRPVQAAAMALLAFRTGQADPRLASMVEAAARAGEVRHIALGPLDPAAAERLAGIEDRPDRARLYRESGGNPLYLLQLARDSGQRAPGGPLSADAPAGISAAIGAELESLSDAAGRLVQAASVAGDPFDFDLAVAVAELEEAEALGALDELIGRDLIRPGDVPRDFAFRHPLVRSAVYEACPPGVRLAAHQRAAVSLAERGAPVIARAHHVEHAARPGDAEAVAVLREAGHAAAARAPTSAARWFSDALRILPGSAPVAERVELLTSLAGSQAATGHLEESRSSLLEALGLASGDGGGAVRTRLVTACAAIDQLLGRHVEAQARLQGALSDLGERPSPDGASLMIELAFAAFHRTDYELMLQWAARALDVAGALGEPTLKAAATGMVAFAHTCVGAISEAESHRDDAITLTDALTDAQLMQRPDALQWLTAGEVFLDHFQEGAQHSIRGLEVARASGRGELFPGMIQGLANIYMLEGRLSEAASLLDGAVDAARLTDNAIALAWSSLNRAQLGVVEGNLDAAVPIAEKAEALTRGNEVSYVAARARSVLGVALLEASEPERAAALLQSLGGETMSMLPAPWRASAMEALTRSLLALGRVDDARRTAAGAEAAAAALGLPLGMALADRAVAAVALASDDARTTVARAIASAERASDLGARVDIARARTLAGRAFAISGDRDEAVALLREAARALDGMGAAGYRDEAERELKALGQKPERHRRRPEAEGDGVDSLSERELEVARLVVERRTNPEIAAELFLSVKTVETHLRNTFRKLGVGSRAEVARVMEGHG